MADLDVAPVAVERAEEILSPEAMAFVAALNRRFRGTRDDLLVRRQKRRAEIAESGRLDFLPETAEVRAGDWQVAPAPADLLNRRVEMTGPTERKMTINALNSGARVWLADIEDANTPHWANVVSGQVNLADAVRGTITFQSPEGKRYELTDGRRPVILMRPRGWHLDERHIQIDGQPAVGALVDFGLHFFHNAAELLARGSGPYFYLPKMESHLEARLWNDVFTFAESELGLPAGSIRATVLIETINAAFEMDEILYELREHSAGLNAGRWDYLFSIIKNFRDQGARFQLPDRNTVTMAAPFMRSYAELLVHTCHRRGAAAIGGMAAFIPSRRDAAVNEQALAKVREDKEREAGNGFDGSWVAHPDLVPLCAEVFDAVLGAAPNQLDRPLGEISVTADQLLDIASAGGSITLAGLRGNVAVALRYMASWLSGNGAAAIFNLMEDAATAEIGRTQLWQWIRNKAVLDDGSTVTAELVGATADAELARIRGEVGAERYAAGHYEQARQLFDQVTVSADFVDFLTIPGYDLID
ncbi:MAG TPA: malate synthase A [Mycobacteriales bacterium]|nr:malate synthase A [Mycobacteriales bacterium]